jgi:hypothetical protein
VCVCVECVCVYIHTHTLHTHTPHTDTHRHTLTHTNIRTVGLSTHVYILYIYSRELGAHLLIPVDGVTAELVTDTLGLGLEVVDRLRIPPLGPLAGSVKLAALSINALRQSGD